MGSYRYIDEVFAESSWDKKPADTERYSVDIFAMAPDWRGKLDGLSKFCEVRYLDSTENISTTEIKQFLSQVNQRGLDNIETTLHSVIEIVKSLSGRHLT